MVLTLCMAMGLTLYIYAEIICKGAVLARFDYRKISKGVVVFCLWQLAMIAIGAGVATFIEGLQDTEQMQEFTWIASVFIFVFLTVKMFHKAWKNELIEERREDVLVFRNVITFSAGIGFRTMLIGFVLGFVEVNLVTAVILFAFAAVIVFIAGLYSGYRLGYGHKTAAYIAAALCFMASGIYLIVAYFA